MKYRITFTEVSTMNVADKGEYFTTNRQHVVKTNNPDSEIAYYTETVGLQVVKVETKNDKGEWGG